jgi:hypothetical protein
MHHIVRRNACKSAKLRCAELNRNRGHRFIPPLQGRPRTSALVMAVAFPHHAVQEKTAPDALSEIAGRDVCEAENGERRGGE